MSANCGHPGLLLYRFFGAFGADNKIRVPEFVRTANRIYSTPAVAELLTAIHNRQRTSLDYYRKQGWHVEPDAPLRTSVTWRLAVGLSYGRLWEVGLQLHPLYGIPYLPGSGIKGAVRRWAIESGDCLDAMADALFGAPDGRANVVLFDGYPLPGKNLVATDIVNKHHKAYYEAGKGQKAQPPADYNTPEPVKFLTIPSGVSFALAYAVRPGTVDPQQVRGILLGCMRHAGFGAKTSKGYGRMKPQ